MESREGRREGRGRKGRDKVGGGEGGVEEEKKGLCAGVSFSSTGALLPPPQQMCP